MKESNKPQWFDLLAVGDFGIHTRSVVPLLKLPSLLSLLVFLTRKLAFSRVYRLASLKLLPIPSPLSARVKQRLAMGSIRCIDQCLKFPQSTYEVHIGVLVVFTHEAESGGAQSCELEFRKRDVQFTKHIGMLQARRKCVANPAELEALIAVIEADMCSEYGRSAPQGRKVLAS